MLDTNGDPHLSDPRDSSNQEVCPKVHGKLPARECRSSLSLYIPSGNQAWLLLDVVPFSLMIFPAINLHLGVFQLATFDYQRLPGVYPLWSCPKIWYPLVPFSTDWFIRLITDGWLTICSGAACCPLCIGDYHDSWTAYNPFLSNQYDGIAFWGIEGCSSGVATQSLAPTHQHILVWFLDVLDHQSRGMWPGWSLILLQHIWILTWCHYNYLYIYNYI